MTLELTIEDKNLIKSFTDKLESCKSYSKTISIKSKEEMEIVVTNLKKIKARRKELDDKRKSIVDAPNKFVKDVNGQLNPLIKEFKTIEDEIDKKTQSFLFAEQEKAREAKEAEEKRIAAEIEEKRQAELAKLEEEKDNFDTTPEEIKQKEKEIEEKIEIQKEELELKVVQPEPTKINGLTEYTKFDIVNEDEVPRDLCSPDDKKIRAFGKNFKFEKEMIINGIRFYKIFKTK